MKLAALALALCACGSKPPPHSTTMLELAVTDQGAPIAARVLLFAKDQPVHLGTIDLYGQRQGATACEYAPGVIGTWDGIVLAFGKGAVAIGAGGACSPPYGRYTVWAWHGFDHEIWKGEVDLSADRGPVALAIPLQRAWTQPANVLAADLHVHAHASNDSGMPDTQRVAAQVAAGIQVIGLSNHNQSGDASAAIHQLGLDAVVWSIPSNEITSEMMHAGIYPATSAPPADQIVHADPKTLLALLRALPQHPIIQINHPRFRYQSLFDTTHWDGVAWPPPFPLDFDAVEVVAGYSAANALGDRRLDDTLRDLYTFYEHGVPVAVTGGSDTHDFNWVLDGTARTYVTLDRPGYDQDAFVAAIRAHHTMASSGPWLAASVGPVAHGKATLTIDSAAASWMHVTRIRIQIGSVEKIVAWVPHLAVEIDIPGDTFVGVAVDGDDPLPLPLTGTYQRDKWNRPGVTPFAVISPILVKA
ncbi:MAG TPA: CehA/McbA family metallohydrolase [Kofleriaceae bacterium]|nr:CehA/McbA family metallohydrolase [Kofleriaceae bacterium]